MTARSQSPTEPIQPAIRHEARLPYQAYPVRCEAVATSFGEVGTHHEPPASETRSLQACSKGHAMSAEKIRYKRAVHAQPQSPDGGCGEAVRAANHPSLIYPPGLSVDRGRQRGLVGHFLFSAKFICMGKQKNGLTATQPSCRRARFLRNWSPRLCARTRGAHPVPATRTALCTAQAAARQPSPVPTYPVAATPQRQRMHHLLSQDIETNTHDSDLPCTTRPVPPTLHHLPCTS